MDYDPENYNLYTAKVRENSGLVDFEPTWIILGTWDGVQDPEAERKAHEACREWLNEHWGPQFSKEEERSLYDLYRQEYWELKPYPGWYYDYGDLDAKNYNGQFHTLFWEQWVPASVTQIENTPASRQREAERAERQRLEDLRIGSMRETIHAHQFQVKPELQYDWDKFFAENDDYSYGGATVQYARYWGYLMEQAMATGKTVAEVMDDASDEADEPFGITGNMLGYAAGLLSRFWIYGDEFRVAHNKAYGGTGEENGTINPAVLKLMGLKNPETGETFWADGSVTPPRE